MTTQRRKARLATSLRIFIPLVIAVVLAVALVSQFRGHTFAVLSPAGEVAHKERNLIFVALLLSLLVVIPVFAMTIYIVVKYRASNGTAKYTPEWDHSRRAETIWWVTPSLLILILAVITWNSSHDLDPFKPLNSSVTPITVQVVAMDWKWLFIYPEQQIASVNLLELPVNTPVNLQITSDAPMNSFWVPQLSGQIYAMSGMTTQLHLMASKAGDYRGSSANISGTGFAGMEFTARAASQQNYQSWLASVRQSNSALTPDAYNQLAQPSTYNKAAYYSPVASGLYNNILMKYMDPEHSALQTVASQ